MNTDFSREPDNLYIDPRTDAGFKILFGNDNYTDVLIFFLNAVLEEDLDSPIVRLKHLDKELLGDDPETRRTIFDIYCETACGKRIIVEMQHASQDYFVKRSVYYNSRAVSAQGVKGGWDFDFMPVYGVFVLDFTLPELGSDWLVHCDIWNRQLNKPLTDCIRWKYIQLPNFGLEDSGLCIRDIEKITYLINNMGNMTTTMPFLSDRSEFTRMEELCRLANLDSDDRLHYERELKYYRDKHNQLVYAEKKGRAEGRAEGRIEGRAEGRIEGRADVIRKFLQSGMTRSKIAEIMEVPEEEISRIIHPS